MSGQYSPLGAATEEGIDPRVRTAAETGAAAERQLSHHHHHQHRHNQYHQEQQPRVAVFRTASDRSTGEKTHNADADDDDAVYEEVEYYLEEEEPPGGPATTAAAATLAAHPATPHHVPEPLVKTVYQAKAEQDDEG